MKKAKEKKPIKPGQIWTTSNGTRGFYIISKCDKDHWYGSYIEKISDNKFIEKDDGRQLKVVKSKDKKTPIRSQNLWDIFKLEEDAELVKRSK